MREHFKSDSAFLNWLRGGFRRIWNKSPAKIEYKKTKIYKKINPTSGKLAQFIDCELCGEPCRANVVQVDHVEPCGSLTMHNWTEFLYKLLLMNGDQLQCACKPCHKIKSFAETYGLTFEQARIKKQIIAWVSKASIARQACKNHNIEYKNLKQARADLLDHYRDKGDIT